MTETIHMSSLKIRFLESKESTGGSLDLFEMTVQPNARMPVPHYHKDWDETVYGLAGALVFQIDGREVTVTPGQTLFIPRGVVHGFSNTSQQPAICLCALTPGVLGPSYFREMAVLLASTPPGLAQMKETMLRHGLVPVPPA